MFYPVFLSIVCGTLLIGLLRDPGDTVRRVVLAATLFAPAWMTCQLKSIQLDHRTAAMLAGLTLLVLLFGHLPLRKWLWTDTLIVAVWLGQVASAAAVDQLRPLTAIEMARLWLLPYLCGRVFFLSWRGELPRLMPLMCGLLALTAALDAFEAISKVNLVNRFFGKTFGVLEAGEGYRWGMKRSQGPMIHPIYNGMMLTLMLPWALSVFRAGWVGTRKKWAYLAAPLLLASAVFFSVSRGPQLAFLVSCGAVVFFAVPRYRWLTFTLAVVVGGGGLVAKDAIMTRVKALAGESKETTRTLVIGGQEVEYSGTNHRMLLFLVYAEAIEETGWFGWGPGMREMPIAEGAGTRFGSIDSHYVKHLLEYGWWGLLTFVGLAVGGVWNAAKVAWRAGEENALFAAGLAGSIFATAVMMNTVWFSFDYGSTWLFCVGLAGCLATLQPPRYAAVSVAAVHRHANLHGPRPSRRRAPVAAVQSRPKRRSRPVVYDGHA